MKTAAKVITIICTVFTAILIIPLIVGIFSVSRINKATSKDELIAPGILSLLFLGLLPGILILLIPESELQPKETKITQAQ